MPTAAIIDPDVYCLAQTVYGEARGESSTGMQAVACVVMNRCDYAKEYEKAHNEKHPLFGDGSIRAACLQPYQFSCWNNNDPNRAIIEQVALDDAIFSQCVQIAQDAIAGNLDDSQITLGATYYYDRRSETPDWAEGKTPCVTIGHHLFFNDID